MKLVSRNSQLYRRVELMGTAVVHDSRTVMSLDIVNMSLSGIFLSISRKGKERVFKLGQHLYLTLTGPRFPAPVQVEGTVRRIQKKAPQGLAIEFTPLSPTTRLQLLASVEEARIESVLNHTRDLC